MSMAQLSDHACLCAVVAVKDAVNLTSAPSPPGAPITHSPVWQLDCMSRQRATKRVRASYAFACLIQGGSFRSPFVARSPGLRSCLCPAASPASARTARTATSHLG